MQKYLFLLITLLSCLPDASAIDKKNMSDWNISGTDVSIPSNAKKLSILDFGGKGDNGTDNSAALQKAIQSLNGQLGIVQIPAGTYLFKKTISVPSNVVIRGEGSDKTILNFNLNGNGDLFSVQGSSTNSTTPVSSGTTKDSKSIQVANAAPFAAGDYCVVKQNANALLASDWAYATFFQIIRITAVRNNTITFDQPLRLDFPAANNPVLIKLKPVQNVGIESLKIKRSDASSGQTSNIFFNYAVQSWVKGVELENGNYAHITLQSSAFITISGNYLHDAFDYGSGGKGYGVVMQFGAGSNLIHDNIFKHLRHSILLQAAANGNVVAYNYSFDPYWTQGFFPASSAGDIVLHGNYPYANLFEGNIFQNLVIDNSHGINGPYNTFFRNRIENYGIVMNGSSGDNMNFIANEITGSGLLKGLYSLSGSQTEIANNIKGSVQSGSISEASLTHKNYNAKIGTPNPYNTWKNEAYLRAAKAVKTAYTNTPGKAVKEESKTAEVKRKTKKTKKKCIRKRKQ